MAERDESGQVIRSDVIALLRCEVCGQVIAQRREGRPRRFCDGRCRSKARRVGVVPAIATDNHEQLRSVRIGKADWWPEAEAEPTLTATSEVASGPAANRRRLSELRAVEVTEP